MTLHANFTGETESPKPTRLTRTVEETLPILGVSRPTLYKLVKDGQLRSIKVGRKILIPLSAIDEFLNGSNTTNEGK